MVGDLGMGPLACGVGDGLLNGAWRWNLEGVGGWLPTSRTPEDARAGI